jgi:hypothetical protein
MVTSRLGLLELVDSVILLILVLLKRCKRCKDLCCLEICMLAISNSFLERASQWHHPYFGDNGARRMLYLPQRHHYVHQARQSLTPIS